MRVSLVRILHQLISFSRPSPTISLTPTFMQFSTSPLRDPFSALPAEHLFDILQQLPIHALLAFSSVSRNLRTLTEPASLNQTIKVAVLWGSEFWMLPVTTVAGE